jgi:predicted Rossmann-fold nucleotide-binding protein
MRTKIWLLALWVGSSLFHGDAAGQSSLQAVDDYFPASPTNLVFNPFRTNVYSAEELLTNCYPYQPRNYYSTPDWIAYICYTNFIYVKKHGNPDELTSRYMRLHDLSIEEALDKYLYSTNPPFKVVGIMGGHDMVRAVFVISTNIATRETVTNYSPYMQVALLAQKLSQAGFTVATGGGPGAMEAGNLGAWFAGYSEEQLSNAVSILARVQKTSDRGLWLQPAFEVMTQYNDPRLHIASIGVPTWFYGFEPPNPFATYIAKYFENSAREEHLLAIANAGIIFTPGGAGTVQEIFQSACQNYYQNYTKTNFPMVLFGVDYWNRPPHGSVDPKAKPAWPLLQQLGAEKNFTQQLLISDDISAITDFIRTNSINKPTP